MLQLRQASSACWIWSSDASTKTTTSKFARVAAGNGSPEGCSVLLTFTSGFNSCRVAADVLAALNKHISLSVRVERWIEFVQCCGLCRLDLSIT